MRVIDSFISKIKHNRKYFIGTMSVLVTALVAVVATLIFMPEGKAAAIVDDPVAKTMTYNLAEISAGRGGSTAYLEIAVDIDDPDYTYYIVGDENTYKNISFKINYNIATSEEVSVYLDNVKINMEENYPVLSFTPSTNTSQAITGSYKIVVKGDCIMKSTCAGATSPVIQVESVYADLYQLKAYNGDDYNNVENYYDLVSCHYNTEVEFTSYEFSVGEAKSRCSLWVETASESYGAGIGTTAGTVDMSGMNVTLSDGTGTPIPDLADGSLMRIFNKPLKVGAQALIGSSGLTGDITISGALELTVMGNGFGAAIGGGGTYTNEKAAKAAGNVVINGGTIYIDAKDIVRGGNTYKVPAIGGGVNSMNGSHAAAKTVVINGGSVYIRDNGLQFGDEGAQPVDSKGDVLHLYETDYIADVNDAGELIISDPRYEEIHRGSITVDDSYMDIKVQYNSSDWTTLMNYNYKGFGYAHSGMGTKLYFYLPATPLCRLQVDENSFLEAGIPDIEVVLRSSSSYYDGKVVDNIDGYYWIPSGIDADITIKNIPSYIDIGSILITETRTNVATDYSTACIYDELTGNYSVTVRLVSDSVLSIRYDSNISIVYDYGFVEGDTHNVSNSCPTKYDLGQEIILDDGYVICDDLTFDGWYSELTDEKITSIDSANLENIMNSAGVIKLKAKWLVNVSYDFGEGTGDTIDDYTLPYGEETQIIISNVTPEQPYHIFEGWSIEGHVCGGGYIYNVTPLGDIVITAVYKQSSYFVYIDASPRKFNLNNVDLYVGLHGNIISDANNLIIKEPDGSYRTKEINGIPYYCAVVENEADIAIVITQKQGHILSGQSIIVTEGNGNQMVVNTGSSENGVITVKLTIDQDDVYISSESEYVLKEYDISFYDGTDSSGGTRLWAEDSFTYTIEDLDKPLSQILGERAAETENIRNRFFKFTGWKDKLTGRVYSNEDSLGENLGDVILVAQWEEIEKYPIDIKVIDNRDNSVSEDVFGIPYYMNEDGSLEAAYVETVIDPDTNMVKNIAYAKEDDKVFIKFIYIDNDGVQKDVTNGVNLLDMQLKYVKESGSSTTENVAEGLRYFVCPKPKRGTGVQVTLTVDIQEYTITYWDTKGIAHQNPSTYTFFDEVVFENLYENVGWLLVTADTDDDNFDSIKTVPITVLRRGSTGNLVLKPDWSQYVEKTYEATVENSSENGSIQIIYPVDKDKFLPNETLVIKVIADKGYKLKNNVIFYREKQEIGLFSGLMRSYTIPRDIAMYGAVEITGSDGIYLVDMPEKNIVISAEFELVQYLINYNEVGELTNPNPVTYTINDIIDLQPLEKEGYEFLGWVDSNGNIINKIVDMTQNLTLTPSWKKLDVADKDNEGETNDGSKDDPNGDSDKDSDGENDNNGGNGGSNGDEDNTGGNQPGSSGNSDKNTGNNGASTDAGNDKPHIIGGGNAYGGDTYTGDSSNVMRLVLISVAAVLVLMILVLTKKDKGTEQEKKESKESKDI